jgi:hypothetical protein
MRTDRMRRGSVKAVTLIVGIALFARFAMAGDSCAKQLPNLVDRSLMILAGRVIKVGPSPGFWSEVLPAIQVVQYDVLATYKGKVPDPQITVSYKVVKGSRLVEKHPPGLSRQVFAEGKELMLFLQTPQQDIGDECAAQVRTPELEKQVQDLVNKPPKNQ